MIEGQKGQSQVVGPRSVRVSQNTGYDFPAVSDMDVRFKSVSFRFDLTDRSIVYTGDAGSSTAVEELAMVADLLGAEMIDLEAVVAAVRRNSPNAGSQQIRNVVEYLNPTSLDLMRFLRGIGAAYAGPVYVANNLDKH